MIVVSAEEILKTKIIEKAWEDAAFKKQLLADPKSAIQEAFGIAIPDSIELKALEETTNQFYLVIPPNPSEVLDGTTGAVAMW
jgi:hypothetical protein